MITIKTQIEISAPIDYCFDLARDIDIHTKTVWKHTKEKAIIGVTTGLIEFNQLVTFEATHFLVRQKLTSKIIEYSRPYLFVDEMQEGVFKSLKHIHEFKPNGSKTVMIDTLIFEAPLGILGWAVERMVLRKYMKRFIEHRNHELKKLIEQQFVVTQEDANF